MRKIHLGSRSARNPQKIRQIELRSIRLVNETLAGQYHSVFKGQGMNFDEVREYQPGDEVRSIDWNVTARMNHPFVKKFVEERELTVMLVVDMSASGLFGSQEQSKRELTAEIASVLAFSAIRNNDKVGLILFTEEVEKFIPPRRGRRHLAGHPRDSLYQPRRTGTDLNSALEFLMHVTRHRAIVVVLSDFLGQTRPTRAEIAAHLRRSRDPLGNAGPDLVHDAPADQPAARCGGRANRGPFRAGIAGAGLSDFERRKRVKSWRSTRAMTANAKPFKSARSKPRTNSAACSSPPGSTPSAQTNESYTAALGRF